jgi:hypothetical protein
MGTPYLEIQAAIFRQVYQYAGTQLRAAIALGITPDTVSRILRRSERRRFAADSAASPEPMAEEKQPCGQPRTAEPLARAVGQIERARERAMRSERKLFAVESPYLEDSDPSLDSADQEALMTDD